MARTGIFKVDVTYENDAHPPQRIAVHNPRQIKTAADAVAHCLKTLHHKDEEGTIHKCLTAVPVSDKPFTEAEAPRVHSIDNAPQAPEELAAATANLPADPRATDDGA